MLTPLTGYNASQVNLEGINAALSKAGAQRQVIEPVVDLTGGRLMPGATDAKNTRLGLFSTIVRQLSPLFMVFEPTLHDRSLLLLLVPSCS